MVKRVPVACSITSKSSQRQAPPAEAAGTMISGALAPLPSTGGLRVPFGHRTRSATRVPPLPTTAAPAHSTPKSGPPVGSPSDTVRLPQPGRKSAELAAVPDNRRRTSPAGQRPGPPRVTPPRAQRPRRRFHAPRRSGPPSTVESTRQYCQYSGTSRCRAGRDLHQVRRRVVTGDGSGTRPQPRPSRIASAEPRPRRDEWSGGSSRRRVTVGRTGAAAVLAVEDDHRRGGECVRVAPPANQAARQRGCGDGEVPHRAQALDPAALYGRVLGGDRRHHGAVAQEFGGVVLVVGRGGRSSTFAGTATRAGRNQLARESALTTTATRVRPAAGRPWLRSVPPAPAARPGRPGAAGLAGLGGPAGLARWTSTCPTVCSMP